LHESGKTENQQKLSVATLLLKDRHKGGLKIHVELIPLSSKFQKGEIKCLVHVLTLVS
jgi:hypothetical protein